MRSCERCDCHGQECSYEVWDQCISCRSDGHTCWQPIDLGALMSVTSELRNLQRDADSLRTILVIKDSDLHSMFKELLQRKNSLSATSSAADKIDFSQLQEKARSMKMDFDQDKSRFEQLRVAVSEQRKQKETLAHELADLIMDRFAQDCDRCTDRQQACTFPENSHFCIACTDAVVRCSGDADWQDNDLLWHAADPIRKQVDDFLLEHLADASEFKRLKTEEQRLLALEESYFGRSGLTTEEQQKHSQLHTQRLEIRESLERIRSNNLWDMPEYQQLWSLREVLSICEIASTRWWSDYDTELNEVTGYPLQRNLPDADQMTEEQFRNAVAWVQDHPYYQYDGSLSSRAASKEGSVGGDDDAMKIDETPQHVEMVEWPQMNAVLQEVEYKLQGVRLGLAHQLEIIGATGPSQRCGQHHTLTALQSHVSQNGVSLKNVEMQLRESRIIYNKLEQNLRDFEQ